MADVNVRMADLQIRTTRLTRALLKQFRRLQSIPRDWTDGGRLKLDHVVGWFHGSVLGDEFALYTLLTDKKGDYFVYAYLWDEVKKDCKQIYIV
jgi:hypothetical protein